MARYINENDVYGLLGERGMATVHCSQIDDLPRADVAPRAEVELWKGRVENVFAAIPKTRREFAREIFEEIEREITDALKSNYKVLPQVEESEALWNNVNGKISGLRGIEYFITELKRKYVGSEPPKEIDDG